MRLPLDQIQGNITPGFRKDHQAFLMFQWTRDDIPAVRAWVKAILPYIASAREVATFNRAFRLIKKRLPKQESLVLRSTWVNVGFSARGLRYLLPDPALPGFPPEFVSEPGSRATEVDETGVLPSFEMGGSIESVPDAMVIVAADSLEELQTAVFHQLQLAKYLSLMLPPYIGQSLKDGREHFGFRDGISQPDPGDPLEGWDWQWCNDGVVAPGEFILRQSREPTTEELDPQGPTEPPWANNGSYLVFRKLEQHVFRFEEEVQEAINAINSVYAREADLGNTGRERLLDGITPDLMKAKMMGRWASGHKLTGARQLSDPDPGVDYSSFGDMPQHLRTITTSDFDSDDAGDQCPLFAHVRRSHPRTDPKARSRRIIRRGITYGPPVTDRTTDDHQERGIFFLAYQASLRRQFEFIQRNWLNSEALAEPTPPIIQGIAPRPGADPIAGIRKLDQTDRPDEKQLRLRLWHEQRLELIPFPTVWDMHEPVTTKASAYFFVPSIDALSTLTTVPPTA